MSCQGYTGPRARPRKGSWSTGTCGYPSDGEKRAVVQEMQRASVKALETTCFDLASTTNTAAIVKHKR